MSLDELLTAEARRSVEGVGAQWLPPRVGRWLQIVLMPSFHAELVITAVDDGSSCRLQAQTAQCNLAMWDLSTEHPGHWPSGQGAPDRQLIRVEQELTRRLARRLWRAAGSARPDSRANGLDGIGIMIRHRLEHQVVEFHSWSPSKDAKDRRLIDVALAAFTGGENEQLSVVINDCASYFH
ncbi:MAG: hypothetical protein HY828_08780 [Actinobacteria bacterium]|nr:hypothetical protein [Actinomycetota bacterium]